MSTTTPALKSVSIRKRWILLSVIGVLTICASIWVRHRIISSPDFQLHKAVSDPRFQQAKGHLDKLVAEIKADPGNVDKRWQLADSYQKLGVLDLAAEQLEAIVKLQPESKLAAVGLADVRIALVQPKQARDAYQNIIKRWPNDATGWQGLSAVFFHQGMYSESVRAMRRAVELDPKNSSYQFILATSLLRFVQQFPVQQAYIPQIQEAQKILTELLPKWPQPGEVHFRLGSAETMLRNHRAAIVHYSKAVELLPKRADIAAELTDSLMTSGRRPDARAVVEAAIARGLNDAALYDLQGQLIQSSGEPDSIPRALAAFKKAARMEPNRSEYAEHYGGACVRAGDLQQARKAFERAVVLNQERAYPYQQLSAIYTRLGDTKQATAAAKMATQMVHNEQQLRRIEELSLANPENINLHLILGDRYRDLNLYGASRANYEMVMALNPGNQRAKMGLDALAQVKVAASGK